MSQFDLLMDGLSRAIASSRTQTTLAWVEHTANVADNNGWGELARELHRLDTATSSGAMSVPELRHTLHVLRGRIRAEGVQ